MVVETYGIFLSGHTQYLTFRCIELNVIFQASCIEVGQGFLQALTVRRGADSSIYNLVSSAYIAEEPSDMASRRSLIKTTNSNGPKRLLCGTPEITGEQLDGTPSITTL